MRIGSSRQDALSGLGDSQGWLFFGGHLSGQAPLSPVSCIPLAQAGASLFWGDPPQPVGMQQAVSSCTFSSEDSRASETNWSALLYRCSLWWPWPSALRLLWLSGSATSSWGETLPQPCSDHPYRSSKSQVSALPWSPTGAVSQYSICSLLPG